MRFKNSNQEFLSLTIETLQDSITEDSEGEEQELNAEGLEEKLCRNVLQVVMIVKIVMTMTLTIFDHLGLYQSKGA